MATGYSRRVGQSHSQPCDRLISKTNAPWLTYPTSFIINIPYGANKAMSITIYHHKNAICSKSMTNH